jgi:hypothetical protein
VLSFLRRRRPPPKDPLAAFDALIEDLHRQGAVVRRSAAALLTSRSELVRAEERLRSQLADMDRRIPLAAQRIDAKAEAILRDDRARAQAQLEATQSSLARAGTDAQLLLQLAKELADQAQQLGAERANAQARLTADSSVTDALRARADRIERALAVDAARDDLERAHALAQIYREDAGR